LNNLAVLYQDKGDKRAEPTALQAYKRADKSPEVADTYGWILLQNGKVDEAAKILAAAAAGAPKHPDIQFHYAMAVAKTGKVDDARKQLTELLAQYQKFPTRAEAEKALSELK
jgi:predicted Zn-dependent protease